MLRDVVGWFLVAEACGFRIAVACWLLGGEKCLMVPVPVDIVEEILWIENLFKIPLVQRQCSTRVLWYRCIMFTLASRCGPEMMGAGPYRSRTDHTKSQWAVGSGSTRGMSGSTRIVATVKRLDVIFL